MEGGFTFIVEFKGEPRSFAGRLVQWGYSYRFEVELSGMSIVFEPDEERHLRAIVHPDQARQLKVDQALLQAIASALENIGR